MHMHIHDCVSPGTVSTSGPGTAWYCAVWHGMVWYDTMHHLRYSYFTFYTNAHTHIPMYTTHTCMHTCTCMHTHMHALLHPHTSSHERTHTHAHSWWKWSRLLERSSSSACAVPAAGQNNFSGLSSNPTDRGWEYTTIHTFSYSCSLQPAMTPALLPASNDSRVTHIV